jgi:hypothetical protein
MKTAAIVVLVALSASRAAPDVASVGARDVRLARLPRRASHAPRLLERETPGSSTNWAGPVVTSLASPTSGAVSDVKGSWIVPDVAPSQSRRTFSAVWVGIDGYTDKTVEQIGTEEDWTPKGPRYYAWFEMFPRYGYRLTGFPVGPGDEISAEVRWDGDVSYELTITNVTQNATYTTTQRSKRSKNRSAEWIVEAPAAGKILRLADFGTAVLTRCTATIDGREGAIDDPAWQDDLITMQARGVEKAAATPPGRSGTSFSVTWEHE